jgi:hypothetical protein
MNGGEGDVALGAVLAWWVQGLAFIIHSYSLHFRHNYQLPEGPCRGLAPAASDLPFDKAF